MAPFCCALILGACVLFAHPFLRMGFNDDWSYIWSAKILAQTGRVTYNGWGAMMLGWQLYLGALFIKIFGFSFTTARMSVFLVALLTAAVLQRVIVRCGVSEWNAAFATLTVTLAPIFLPLAFSFMTDIPALFCIVVCVYGGVRALQAASDRAALGWLAFAALSNILGGTVRQIAWLGVLVIVPSVAWSMRRRRGAVACGLALSALGLVCIYAVLHWFYAQPYTFAEPLRAKAVAPLRYDGHCLLAMVFCALPIFAGFLARFRFKRSAGWTTALVCAPIAYLLGIRFLMQGPRSWLAPFSVDEMSSKGVDIPNVLIGYRPEVMRLGSRAALTVLTVLAVVACVSYLSQAPRSEVAALRRGKYLAREQLFWLFGPYSAAYLLLIVTREYIWDRYWIPLLVVFCIALIRAYETRVADRLPALSMVALGLMAIFSVASTHDLFATFRATLDAAESLQSHGVRRDAMYAGVGYDGWTELELTGHINNYRLEGRPGSYRRYLDAPVSDCRPWWESWMPDMHPKYVLSYGPLSCLAKAQFGPFLYRTWLPPHDREIYVLKDPKTLISLPGASDTRMPPDGAGAFR